LIDTQYIHTYTIMFAALSIFVIAATSLSWTIQESAAFSLFPQQPPIRNHVSETTVWRGYGTRPILYRPLTPTTTTVLFMAAAGSSPNWNSNDPFVVLGLEPSPNLDKKAIKRAYKRLALQYHPDMTTTKDSSAEDKRIASDRFAKINWAYEILSGKREAANSASSTPGASSSSSSSTSTGGWTPPHRRTGAYASSSSAAGKSTASTDWRDYMPDGGYYKDDTNYDTGGDSLGKIFSDLFAGAAAGVAAGRAAGGGGIFKDFVEFLEKNVDGYASVGRGGSGSPGIVEDAELEMILQTGSLEDVGDEMDETELVVKQLTAKLQNVDNEVIMLTAELASTTKFTEKLQIEERIEELQARRKVAESYTKKARKRLLALQTRYKQMIVNGDNDPVAGGRSRSYSSSWDSESSPKNEPSSRSSSYSSSSSSSSQRTSSASSTSTDRNDDSSWKADEGFGSFGRGRGSSRRRVRREGETSSPSGSTSSSSSYRASPDNNASASSPSGSRSNASESKWQSTSSSSPSSSSSSSSSSTYVPPHRRSPSFAASQIEQDKQRLRELKVDEEFDKLKKELGL